MSIAIHPPPPQSCPQLFLPDLHQLNQASSAVYHLSNIRDHFRFILFYLVDERRGLKIQESSIQSKIELVDRSFVRSSDRLRLQRSSTYGGGGGARLQCNSSSSFVKVQHDGRHGRGDTSSTQLITASITAAVAI